MPIDYSKYPKNWKEIRTTVLERAGNRCEVCGVKNYEWLLSLKVMDRKGKLHTEWIQEETLPDFIIKCQKEKQTILSIKHVRVILTIAHLDHDADNHDVELNRLKAMCQLCHLRYDKQEHRRSKKRIGTKS
jgi:endo-1,4-beta-D-glucanase Y